MSKVMLVNVTHVEESRVAILEDGVLAGYEIETINRTNIKGNIYNAVVESVHATLEAAFVKLASDLKGFLPLDGVNFKLLPSRGERGKTGRIGQHLNPGQRLMAQVVREPFAGKPPTVSTYFSLPGRFLVLMPGVDSSGISRKIENAEQRDRLKRIVDELKLPDGFGLIVRTAGIGQTKTELQRDLRYLLRLWESIQKGSKASEFPGLVYREADLVIRTIRDFMTPDVSEVWIDSQETYENALRFVRDVMPNRARTLKLYTGDRPLFNKFNLEEQIERIYKRRVPLPSGGEIVIDGTEALTAIDVNSARSKRQGDIEDNNLQTNLEAASEIARQLRLRDLGGLIVIDYIDMMPSRNRSKVEKAMRDAMKGDRARYDITRLSKLGLMEIARQRLKGAKMASTYATCVNCEGYGLVKNVETAALAALRKLQTRASRGNIGLVRVALPPDVATWLLNHKREELSRTEQRHEIRVEIVPAEKLLRHESEFETVAREKQDADDQPVRQPVAAVAATREDVEERVAAAKAKQDEKEKTSAKPGKDEKAAVPADKRDRGDDRKTGGESEAAGEERAGATKDSSKEAKGDEHKPRRKRRRRRRGRGSGSNSSGNPGNEDGRERTPDAPADLVPQTVRADELMPAASGSSGKKGRSRNGGGWKRRGASGSGRA